MASTIPDSVYNFCRDPRSVSSLLATDPDLTPGEAAKKLYHPDNFTVSEGKPPTERIPASHEELRRAYECGKWGPTRPSELFLRIFHDSLGPLRHDPLMGVCSPSLLGSCGVLPLTVVAPLPDICRHMVSVVCDFRNSILAVKIICTSNTLGCDDCPVVAYKSRVVVQAHALIDNTKFLLNEMWKAEKKFG